MALRVVYSKPKTSLDHVLSAARLAARYQTGIPQQEAANLFRLVQDTLCKPPKPESMGLRKAEIQTLIRHTLHRMKDWHGVTADGVHKTLKSYLEGR